MASIVKLAFGGDTRRLPAATATSISAVHAHAAALFGVAAPVLTYVDEDGDAITITTDAELTAALSEAGKALKITVKLAPQVGALPGTPPPPSPSLATLVHDAVAAAALAADSAVQQARTAIDAAADATLRSRTAAAPASPAAPVGAPPSPAPPGAPHPPAAPAPPHPPVPLAALVTLVPHVLPFLRDPAAHSAVHAALARYPALAPAAREAWLAALRRHDGGARGAAGETATALLGDDATLGAVAAFARAYPPAQPRLLPAIVDVLRAVGVTEERLAAAFAGEGVPLPPPFPPVHFGVECDACSASPIVGGRHRCTTCEPSFDLCDACFNFNSAAETAGSLHPAAHALALVPPPPQGRPAPPGGHRHFPGHFPGRGRAEHRGGRGGGGGGGCGGGWGGGGGGGCGDAARSRSGSGHHRHHHRGGGGGGAAAAAAGAAAVPAAPAPAAPPAPPSIPAPTAPVTHDRVTCDACGIVPIAGTRFKCAVCDDFDLCGPCHTANFHFNLGAESPTWGTLHDVAHPFLALSVPQQAPAALFTVLAASAAAGAGAGDAGAEAGDACGPCGSGGPCGGGGGGGGGGMCGGMWGPGSWRGRRMMRSWLESRVRTASAAASQPPPSASGSRVASDASGGGGGGGGFGFGGWADAAAAWAAAANADLRGARGSAPSTPSATAAAAAADAAAAEDARVLELAIQESLGAVAAQAAAAQEPTTAVAARGGAESAASAAGAGGGAAAAFPSAKFVATLTQAGGSGGTSVVVAPGASLTKAWRLKNEGDAAWPEGTVLAFVGGERLGAPDTVPVPAVAPGAAVDIAVPLLAPAAPGRYTAYFRLQAPPPSTTAASGAASGAGGGVADGAMVRFGHRVWADVFVELPPPSVPAPTPIVTLVSDGGAVVTEPAVVQAARGNANAAAVLAALQHVVRTVPEALGAADAGDGGNGGGAAASGGGGGGGGDTAPAAPPPSAASGDGNDDAALIVSYEARWPHHLAALASMGFTDALVTGRLLAAHNGNVSSVVHSLLDMPAGSAAAAAGRGPVVHEWLTAPGSGGGGGAV